MHSLKLLGGASIETNRQFLTGRAVQRHQLALLALLAVRREGALSRDLAAALLWPESGQRRARHRLNVSVHVLRTELGNQAVVSAADGLSLNFDVVAADVVEFEDAAGRGDHRAAVDLYKGPFLDGFHLSDASEFELWVDTERQRLRRVFRASLESLAGHCVSEGDHLAAADWWARLLADDPYDSRVTLNLVKALAASGRRAEAIRRAEEHCRQLREDLEAEPEPDVLDFAEQLRRTPESELPATLSLGEGEAAADYPPHLGVEAAEQPVGFGLSGKPPRWTTQVRWRLAGAMLMGLALVATLGLGLAALLLEVTGLAAEQLLVPPWVFRLLLAVLIVALLIVLATAFLQEGLRAVARQAPTLLPGAETAFGGRAVGRLRRLFSWRNAFVAGLLLFALWGAVAAGWLVLVGPPTRAEALAARAEIPARRRIAVLPLLNMSGNPDHEYFSDALTDEIRSQLAKLADLKVISLHTVLTYKGSDKSLPEIAEELGVGSIVEGSVQLAGDRVYVTAQLIDARTDEHLWADAYDRDLTDVFEVRSDMALQIARAVRATVFPEERARIERKPTVNMQAYDLYVLGRHHWRRRGRDEMERAIPFFQQAIALDSTFALAYSGLADTYLRMGGNVRGVAAVFYPAAEAAATRALQLDSTLAEAHTSLARFRYENYDLSRVEAGYLRAIELDPGYMEAHLMYAFYLASLGLTDGAIAELRVAIGLEPRYPLLHVWLGRLLYYARRYDESIEQYRQVIDWDSGGRPSATVSTRMLSNAHGWLGKTYLIQSMAEEAVIAFQENFRLNRYPPEAVSALVPLLYAVAGQGPVPPALRVLDAMSERRTVLSYHLAWLYLGLGETDRALEHLEEAYEMKERMLLDLKVDPVWDPIRSDPRYLSLLQRLGLN